MHELVQPTDFGTVAWNVCAPPPKPQLATLAYSYNLTSRSGIGIDAYANEATGCVTFIAVQGPDYTPAPLKRRDNAIWKWNDIQDAAPGHFDIRQAIRDKTHGILPYAAKADNDPFIDEYDALHTRPGAAMLRPTDRVITQGADDQPFPMYGRIQVQWRLPACSVVQCTRPVTGQ
jgi:hypothetical protein